MCICQVAEEPRESGSSGPRRAFWRRGLSESTFDVLTFCVTFRFILHFSVKCRDSQSKIRSTRGLAKFAEVFESGSCFMVFDVAFRGFLFFFVKTLVEFLEQNLGQQTREVWSLGWRHANGRNDKKRILFRWFSSFIKSLIMFFCRVWFAHTLSRQWRNQKKTVGFATFFSWKIYIFSVQFGRGYPRKIAGQSCNSVLFSVRWQIRLFHTIFAGGPLAKWRNQKPRVEFATFFCGKVAFF